jgi:hypothetical protein
MRICRHNKPKHVCGGEGVISENMSFIQQCQPNKTLEYYMYIIKMALSTKMSQLGHYETIRTFGNVHWEHSTRVKSHENNSINMALEQLEGTRAHKIAIHTRIDCLTLTTGESS